jgi:hypothetical protein
MLYEIRVKGHLHHRWSPWLYDFDVTHLSDGTTALTGALPDAAAVYGLLSRLRDMGLVLLSLGVLDKSASDQRSV